jgi:quinol monooxygenase YgiN
VPAKPLRVIVPIVAKPDRVEQMRQLLVSLIAPSSAEDGCRSYELLHNLQDPTDFTVIEEWQSETHYAGHLSSPHVQEALGQILELGAKPLEIRRYERLTE